MSRANSERRWNRYESRLDTCSAPGCVSFAVEPGRHVIEGRLRDSRGEGGFDYRGKAEIELKPGERFVVDFRPELGGFMFGSRRVPVAGN